MGYTKSEWVARYAGAGLPWYIETPTREVAKILVYHIFPDKEAEANARLIASAPDMYEALKGIIPLIKSFTPFQSARPEIELAYKAIAKAEGVEQ